MLWKNQYIWLILLKIFIHVFLTNTLNLRSAHKKIYWELYTLDNPEIQIAMPRILKHCNGSLLCQKLPFLIFFRGLLFCNVQLLRLSGFNLNCSVISSFWLPLLGFCSNIFFLLFTSCCSVLHFFFFYDNNNSLLPKGILRLSSLICMRASNYSDKHHWGCMYACVYISLQKHTSIHIYLNCCIYC